MNNVGNPVIIHINYTIRNTRAVESDGNILATQA